MLAIPPIPDDIQKADKPTWNVLYLGIKFYCESHFDKIV